MKEKNESKRREGLSAEEQRAVKINEGEVRKILKSTSSGTVLLFNILWGYESVCGV